PGAGPAGGGAAQLRGDTGLEPPLGKHPPDDRAAAPGVARQPDLSEAALHQLTGLQFLVTIRAEGEVSALPMCATTVDDTLSHAVGLELERALEDALQGD